MVTRMIRIISVVIIILVISISIAIRVISNTLSNHTIFDMITIDIIISMKIHINIAYCRLPIGDVHNDCLSVTHTHYMQLYQT